MSEQLREWRDRWDQGDTKFVPELFERVERYEKALKEIKTYSNSPYNGASTIRVKAIARKVLEGDC